jgi:hypothetical protein
VRFFSIYAYSTRLTAVQRTVSQSNHCDFRCITRRIKKVISRLRQTRTSDAPR